MEAQKETITFLTNSKLDSNQESTVGVMTMAGKRIDVLVSPCRTSGAISKALTKEVKIDGKINFSAALKTAQLVLKNRQNKNQKQRIIAFVGSPVEESTDNLVELGKKLSKLNIAVDVVLFGTESQDYREKLEAFINAVQNAGNSHLCVVPPGPHDMSDLVLPTLMAGMTAGPAPAGGVAAPGGASAAGFPAGPEAPIQGADGRVVDPRLDPETALAIRMSMEEEYQRQQKLAKDNKAAGAASPPASSSSAASSSAASSKPAAAVAAKPVQTPAPVVSAGAKPAPAAPSKVPSKVKDEDEMEDEEDDLELAMKLSMQPGEEPEAAKDKKQAKPAEGAAAKAGEGAGKKGDGEDQGAGMEDVASVLQDPEFLSNLLKESGVENVSVDSLLNELGEEADEEEDENK